MAVFSDLIQGLVDDVGLRQKVRTKADVESFHSWVLAQPKVETILRQASIRISMNHLKDPQHGMHLCLGSEPLLPICVNSFLRGSISLER
jgi:hypothetical protein